MTKTSLRLSNHPTPCVSSFDTSISSDEMTLYIKGLFECELSGLPTPQYLAQIDSARSQLIVSVPPNSYLSFYISSARRYRSPLISGNSPRDFYVETDPALPQRYKPVTGVTS